MSREIVYTAIMGSYEKLLEQPLARSSSARFICFTDSDGVASDSWEVRKVQPRFEADPVRSARYLKVMGDPALDGADRTMWIDNRIELKRPPEDFFGEWLVRTSMALPSHSFNASVLDEFSAVLANAYDSPRRVREQLQTLRQWAPEILTERPYWTAILLRRNDARVASAMRWWMDYILRYSRRDQLSINLALRRANVETERYEIDNWESSWHRWIPAKELSRDRTTTFPRGDGFRYSVAERLLDSARQDPNIRRVLARFRAARRGL